MTQNERIEGMRSGCKSFGGEDDIHEAIDSLKPKSKDIAVIAKNHQIADLDRLKDIIDCLGKTRSIAESEVLFAKEVKKIESNLEWIAKNVRELPENWRVHITWGDLMERLLQTKEFNPEIIKHFKDKMSEMQLQLTDKAEKLQIEFDKKTSNKK